jgi:hypothetical protein
MNSKQENNDVITKLIQKYLTESCIIQDVPILLLKINVQIIIHI